MSQIIQPGKFTGGSYKRPRNRIVYRCNLALYSDEIDAVRKGRRGCSCDGSQLRCLGQKCSNIASEVGAKSWSIYPLPQTLNTTPMVMVEFHNWPEMGMCNPRRPVGKKRYWWDIRAVEEWINPGDERAIRDTTKGNFDPEA